MSYAQHRAAIVLTAAGLISAGCTATGRASAPRVTGSGPVRSHVRALPPFSRVSIGVGSTVRFEIGPAPGLEIKAQDNVARAIDSKVVGGDLMIDTSAHFSGSPSVELVVRAPRIDGFTILGSAHVTATPITATTFEVVVNGSGDVNLEGQCDDLKVVINGSGYVDLSKFAATRASASINGAGNIRMNVIDNLDARINGSGEIRYQGAPKVTKSVAGVGRVEAG